MRRGFYLRLAAGNIKKNGKVYLPFLLTCICTVCFSYIMLALMLSSGMSRILGAEQMRAILMLGYFVMCIFSVIFLFYTNSFLMKQRKKEFGIFNILGMEKKHIAKVIFYETFYIAFLSITLGLLAGILLNKLCVLLILKMIHADVVLGFEISISAMTTTMILFAAIFLLILLNNIRQVHLTNPIELLRGGNVGEKEPKTKWIMAIFGLVCLGAGYYIAITTEDPINAMLLFFVAVLLVMAGTYLLFAAGSIAVLKGMRKNQGYYYQPKHFISVSGMIYRMKKNAVGLANICILSTGVLLLISITVSLYSGTEDAISVRYPSDLTFNSPEYSEEEFNKMNNLIEQTAKEQEVQLKSTVGYPEMNTTVLSEKDGFGVPHPGEAVPEGVKMFYFLTVDAYNEITGAKESLDHGQVFVLNGRDNIYEKEKVKIFDCDFDVKAISPNDDVSNLVGESAAVVWESYYIIVDEVQAIEELQQKYAAVFGEEDSPRIKSMYSLTLSPDTEDTKQIRFAQALQGKIQEAQLSANAFETRAEGGGQIRGLYSGFLFIGILLGMVFFMATALIIYYKQISEGYEDKERYAIMQKVGMSRHEVKQSIHSQILTVFFLPLLTAGIHLTMAFPLVRRMLSLLMLTNEMLFIICTITCFVLFAVCYALIYTVTARSYYKIVSPGQG